MINRMYVIILLSVLPLTACGSAQGGEKTEAPEVYFIREITPRNMVRIYEAHHVSGRERSPSSSRRANRTGTITSNRS